MNSITLTSNMDMFVETNGPTPEKVGWPRAPKYHEHFQGSQSSHWMDSGSNLPRGKVMVNTESRNGNAYSIANMGFGGWQNAGAFIMDEGKKPIKGPGTMYFEAINRPCRRIIVPLAVQNKEIIESCKWTKKPPFQKNPNASIIQMKQKKFQEKSMVDKVMIKLNEKVKQRKWQEFTRDRSMVRELENWEHSHARAY